MSASRDWDAQSTVSREPRGDAVGDPHEGLRKANRIRPPGTTALTGVRPLTHG